jgi:hypothetical protein
MVTLMIHRFCEGHPIIVKLVLSWAIPFTNLPPEPFSVLPANAKVFCTVQEQVREVLEILTFQQDLKSSINLQVPDDRKQRST